jgi:DNA-directed RNA polymerase subunit M/transcription elongation factor TFIIS
MTTTPGDLTRRTPEASVWDQFWRCQPDAAPLQSHQPTDEDPPRMDQPKTPSRTCPACGSANYTFRSRKQIESTPEQEAMLETKYRCKGCGEEWKEKVPASRVSGSKWACKYLMRPR